MCTLGAVSTGLWIASPPSLTLWVGSWWYLPLISFDGIPRRAGKKLVRIAASRGKKIGAVSATTRWTYYHSFCRQKVKPAYAIWVYGSATMLRVCTVATHFSTSSANHISFFSALPMKPPR